VKVCHHLSIWPPLLSLKQMECLCKPFIIRFWRKYGTQRLAKKIMLIPMNTESRFSDRLCWLQARCVLGNVYENYYLLYGRKNTANRIRWEKATACT
jgi:hypothetical protein